MKPSDKIFSAYVDESDDKDIFVMSCVLVPTLKSRISGGAPYIQENWDDFLSKAKDWRASLKHHFNIPVKKELKGSKLAPGRNSYNGGKARLHGPKAADAYRYALSTLSFLPDSSVFAVAAERGASLYGYNKLESSLYAMLQRLQKSMEVQKSSCLVFFDEGHGEYLKLYRKARVHLPTGSAFGAWGTGTKSKSIPLDRGLKDANFKDSKLSHFIQIADLVAYAALSKVKSEKGTLGARQASLGHGNFFDQIPKQVRNRKVNPSRADGIVFLKK
ncbi:DUF3800 domain-containing protein [Leisingera sp. D0M16]|uniref:DUF3800 domain-containing protein n=1 Tax=Leisingera coralii TaxID=3351347 RepID=UPI003B7AFEEE